MRDAAPIALDAWLNSLWCLTRVLLPTPSSKLYLPLRIFILAKFGTTASMR